MSERVVLYVMVVFWALLFWTQRWLALKWRGIARDLYRVHFNAEPPATFGEEPTNGK